MSGFGTAMVSVSYLDENGERVVLGNLGSFLAAARVVVDHTAILTLQYGACQLLDAVGPITTEFEDGTVLRYHLEVVDQDDTPSS